jgi:peptidoglycan hydrolase CwlO-like protein
MSNQGGLIPSADYKIRVLQTQVDKLKKQVESLEKKVESLDHRTVGSIRLGGG